MSKAIGIDIGYGFTKVCLAGETRSFPTAVTAVVPQSTFSEVKYVSVNGKNFLVGYDAEREGLGLLDTRHSDFVASNAWLAVMGCALSESVYFPEGGAIVLCLPPGLYTKAYAGKVEQAIKNSKISDRQAYTFDFSKTNIRIIPQGAGIFFSYLYGDPGILHQNVAVLDIGHHTVDIVLFSRGKYVESATVTVPLGISLILDAIAKVFYRKFGLAIRYPEARRLLQEGSISILGEYYSMPEVREIAIPYAMQISSVVDQYFEKLPSSPDLGLAGGGGITVLQGLVKLKKKLHVVKFPEMANSHGCWVYGTKYMS